MKVVTYMQSYNVRYKEEHPRMFEYTHNNEKMNINK